MHHQEYGDMSGLCSRRARGITLRSNSGLVTPGAVLAVASGRLHKVTRLENPSGSWGVPVIRARGPAAR